MAIVVEDGTIVADANSYVTLAEVRTYAALRGITIPAADEDLEKHLHLAMDWFEAEDFPSARLDATQELSFPRDVIVVDGVRYMEGAIPKLVKQIICEATCTSVTIALQPQYAGSSLGQLRKKKVDVLEKEYFPATSTASFMPILAKLDALMQKLLYADGFRLTVLRA